MDELGELPQICETPIKRHSNHEKPNFVDCLLTEFEVAVLPLENDKEKAKNVSNVNRDLVKLVEEELMNFSIVDFPLSSAANLEMMPR